VQRGTFSYFRPPPPVMSRWGGCFGTISPGQEREVLTMKAMKLAVIVCSSPAVAAKEHDYQRHFDFPHGLPPPPPPPHPPPFVFLRYRRKKGRARAVPVKAPRHRFRQSRQNQELALPGMVIQADHVVYRIRLRTKKNRRFCDRRVAEYRIARTSYCFAFREGDGKEREYIVVSMILLYH